MSNESSRALLQELPLPVSTPTRKPHPKLSSEQLRSAQKSPQSCVTSASSQFLTPPVAGARSSSPPPKRDAEDYLAARSRQRHTGKRRSMHRKLQSTTKEGPDHGAGLARPLGSRSSTLASSSSHYDASDSHDREGDTESSFASRFLRSATFSASPLPIDREAQGLWELDRAPTGILTYSQFERSTSPAAKSLQRLKQVDETKSNTSLRRLSENLSSTIQRLRSSTLDPKKKDANSALADEAQSSRQTRPDQREENLSKPNKMTARKLPSTITLRRATLESTPVVADDSSSNVGSPGKSPSSGITGDSKATGGELVAFRSMPLAENDTDSPSSRRRSMYEGHEALQAQLEASQSRSKVFDRMKVTARKASAGEALTRTDVHITPGTFYDEARTVKSSKASNGSPRRLSCVQIVSCDSVNAIIWREEESLSSSSSTQTPSPRRTEPDAVRAGINSRRMVEVDSALPGDAVADQMNLERQGDRKLSREVNMFEWSWGKNSPSSRIEFNDNEPQLLDLGSGDAFAGKHAPKAQREHAASLGNDFVSSFPPLLDRTSTADWQTMPFLISLDSESYLCAPNADVDEDEAVTGLSRDSTVRAKPTSSRKRQSITNASKNGIVRVRLGSCIGSSAGIRIQKRASIQG